MFDTSVLAAIQNLAQQNRQQIAAIQADLNILRKIQTSSNVPSSDRSDDVNNHDHDALENIKNHLVALQEEQAKLTGHMSNLTDDMTDEFNRKQVFISHY